MRILHTIDTTGPGGAEDVFVELSDAIRAAGHRCVPVVPGPSWISDRLAHRGHDVQLIDVVGAFNLAYLRRLVAVVRRERIDVIHSHLFGAGIYSALAGLVTSTPVVATFHGVVDVPTDDRHMSLKSWAVRRAKAIVSVSEPIRTMLHQKLALATERIEVIPNGIDVERFAAARPGSIRADLGISKEAFLVGSVGNIRAAKDYATGLRAVAALRRSGVDAHWVIAGQPDQGEHLLTALRQEAAALGMTPYVHFLGFVEKPEEFLASLDVYLLCSNSEGHPLALCQAMAAGLPLAVTRCGVERLVNEHDDGWVVPVGGVEAMAQVLASIRSAPAEARRRSAHAQRTARAEFNSAAAFGRYLRIYERIRR